jgi:hypothetical protein
MFYKLCRLFIVAVMLATTLTISTATPSAFSRVVQAEECDSSAGGGC